MIVSSPLDIRWSLEKNINRIIPLELIDDTSLAKREHVLFELRLVRWPLCLPFWNEEWPCAGVRLKSKIDCFLRPWGVLTLLPPFRIEVNPCPASESAEAWNIFELTIYVSIRGLPEPLLVCNVACVFACEGGLEPEPPPEPRLSHYSTSHSHDWINCRFSKSILPLLVQRAEMISCTRLLDELHLSYFMWFVFSCIVSHYHNQFMFLTNIDNIAVPFIHNVQHIILGLQPSISWVAILDNNCMWISLNRYNWWRKSVIFYLLKRLISSGP